MARLNWRKIWASFRAFETEHDSGTKYVTDRVARMGGGDKTKRKEGMVSAIIGM